MYATLRQQFYWPNLYTDVHNWAKTCIDCQMGKGGVTYKALLKPLPPPASIFDTWHVDHICLPASKGYKYALVAVDSLSLYSLILPAKTASATKTAKLLFDNLFMVYGTRVLLSDRGSAFRSKLVQCLCALLGTKQLYTFSRHPQTNSKADSFNKNIFNRLRTRCNSHKNWPDLLPSIGFAFLTSVVKSLGTSPLHIVFGQKPKLPIDDLLLPPRNLPKTAQTYFETMKPQLDLLREVVRENKIQAHQKTKRLHDAQSTVKTLTFKASYRV